MALPFTSCMPLLMITNIINMTCFVVPSVDRIGEMFNCHTSVMVCVLLLPAVSFHYLDFEEILREISL